MLRSRLTKFLACLLLAVSAQAEPLNIPSLQNVTDVSGSTTNSISINKSGTGNITALTANSTNTGGSPVVVAGGAINATSSGGATVSSFIYGLSSTANITGGGSAPLVMGLNGQISNASGAGTFTKGWGVASGGFAQTLSGTWTEYDAFHPQMPTTTGAGSVGTATALRIPVVTLGSTNYPLLFETTAGAFFTDANASINASSSGNLNLHASSDIDSDQNISFLDNVGSRYGTGDDAQIFYNGVDLVANPALVGTGVFYVGDGSSPAKLRALTVGLGDSAPANVRPLTMDVTGSTMSSGMQSTINYTGATITMRAQLFEAQHVGANATMNKIAVASNLTASLAGDTTGTVQMFGVNAVARSTVALANTSGAGAYTFQNQFSVTSVAGNTSTQPIYAYSGHFLDPGTFAGAAGTLVRLSGLFSGNVQINSDKKLALEGSDTVEGDSYFIFNTATTDANFFVDNVKAMTWNNDRVLQHVCNSGFTRFGLGCVQTDEEGSGTWDVAREDCFDTYGGRLLTPHELMIAANNFALTNETDDEEWTSEIFSDSGTVECGYLKLNAGTADEAADFADEACGTTEAYRCFVPFSGGN